jgi:hypothetical protein
LEIELLRRLYNQYRETGDFAVGEFLQYRERNLLGEPELNNSLLCLSGSPELDFVCWKVIVKRPQFVTYLGFFVAENGAAYQVDDPVNFLEDFQKEAELPFVWLDNNKTALEKVAKNWLDSILSKLELKSKREFEEEKNRLNLYYEDVYKELNQKRENFYFHNYFFEKERQLMDEFSMIEEEIQACEQLLCRKYKLEIDISSLFFGGVRKV